MRRLPIPILLVAAAMLAGSLPAPGVGAATAATTAATTATKTPTNMPTADTAALVPVAPCRLLDTREFGAAPLAGGTVEVQVAGRCSVPADATAASVTLTSVSAAGQGWLSVHPARAPWPGTSTLNVDAGDVRANTTVVSLGRDGAVQVLNDAGGHVLLDVTAAFVPAEGSSSGRYVAIAPQRITDTRDGGPPAAGTSVRVPLPTGVPDDAVALAINLTTTDSAGAGYFTVHPPGAPPGSASVLNTDAGGQTRAAAAVVPVSPDGLAIHTSTGDHVIVDVTGYFTGPSAQVGSDGLFRSVAPRRVVDTRADGPRLFRDGAREWSVVDEVGAGAGAIVANVTMTDVRSAGWMVVHPSRTARPEISTLNAGVGETVANQAVLPLSTAGITVHSSSSAHVVVDVTGWFVGGPIAGDGPPPVNDRPSPGRTLIVGDSIPAALNTVPDALDELSVLDHVFEAIECRRTAEPSCPYRGAPPPPTAVDVIGTSPGPFDTLVMITGYNDSYTTFAPAIDRVMEAAHANGLDRVVWLTVREDRENLVRNNRHLRDALDRHPDLRLVDWNLWAAGQRDWFAGDNVHLSRLGAVELARFVVETALTPA